MAVTITHVKSQAGGSSYENIVDVTGPASYTSSGEALSAGDLNKLMPRLGGGLVAGDASKVQYFDSEKDAVGRSVVLDRVNGKILFFGAGAEIAGAVALNAVTIRARVVYGMAGD